MHAKAGKTVAAQLKTKRRACRVQGDGHAAADKAGKPQQTRRMCHASAAAKEAAYHG